MSRRVAVIRAVGDIALGDHPLRVGFGTHSICRVQPPDFPFRGVPGFSAGADVVFGNLECTLSEVGLRRHDYHSQQMRGHATYVRGLASAGFNILNVANNHSMQHGAAPFRDTVALLRAAKIEPLGVRLPNSPSCAPVVFERGGLLLGVLGYSLRPRQYFTDEPLYAEGHRDVLLGDVKDARRRYHAVVVSLHWGDEFVDTPSPEEVMLAHDLIENGADLIIGHHPHVLRSVERYGRGYIAYSLGNFVCDMHWDESLREAAILDCVLSVDGVSDLSIRPVRVNDLCQPEYLEGPSESDLDCGIVGEIECPQSPGAFTEAVASYRARADRAHREVRGRSHRYFLRNLHRLAPRIMVQQLSAFARNRLAERSFGWNR